MKIFKKILAATMALAMAASVATTGFAMSDAATAEYKVTSKISAIYEDAGKNYVDVSFYVGKVDGDELVEFESYEGCTVYFKTKYDTANVAHANGDWSTEYTDSKPNMKEANKTSGTLNYTITNDGNAITFDPATALVTIKFEVKQTAAGSYPIFSAVTEVSMADDGNNLVSTKSGNIDATAITAAAYEIEDKEPELKPNANGAYELNDKTVILNTVVTDEVTKDTRVNVTYAPTQETKKFGARMWEDCGFEGAGTITVNNVLFGIVVDADMNAADFTFVIE